jgi:decaprenylphospho-beta-D-erythro-pentofuranosid-2-ulose 2-reductase
MTEGMKQLRWTLLLGTTSGIGRAVARRWAAHGQNLLLAARDLDECERVAADLRVRFGIQAQCIAFDALALDRYENFWRDCLSRASGNLDGVIVCHGFMVSREQTDHDLNLVRQTIDINYTSPALILNLAANEFEKSKQGYIVGVSSIAGDRGRQSNYYYGSAKAAFSAYLAGLRNRLFRSNVHVLTVKPGFVDTAMTWGLSGTFLVASPEHVAQDIWNALQHRRDVLYTPFFWRYIMMIIRHIPEFIFKRMKL